MLAGTTAFLYVADAKLCSRSAMGHIDRKYGRFLCVMPATRAEVGEFRRFIARNTPEWTEVGRQPGKKPTNQTTGSRLRPSRPADTSSKLRSGPLSLD